MASSSGRASALVAEQLLREAYRFDFFQAVRHLERMAQESPRTHPYAAHEIHESDINSSDESQRARVGHDGPAGLESVRFRALASLSFPSGSIASVKPSTQLVGQEGWHAPPEMFVAFMGLTGPSGVLPQHYTSLVIERSHVKNKDHTLRDFLDLFNHRAISLFYRAWEKYRFAFNYERARRDGSEDLFSTCLYCLVGMGTKGLRDRLEFDDEALVYYAGHFAHHPRSASALEQVLEDYFELPVAIEQFIGQWLSLEIPEQTCFPGLRHPAGMNCLLGENAIVGERAWDVQSKFRIKLGPLTYRQFQGFMPIGNALRPLCQLARLYCGQEFDFEVQAVLRAKEVPWCQLGASDAVGSRLGWNTWVRCDDLTHDASQAIFRLDAV